MARKHPDSEQDSAQDSAQPESRPETGFKDVSGAVEQAEKDAQAPTEYDDDGNPIDRSSEAANEVAQEQSYRAGAQVNGGGPWPPELLLENFVGARPLVRSSGEYTSHETDHADA